MANIGHNQQPFVSINSLSSEDKKKLKGVIQELNDSLTRVASERDYQKEAIAKLYDELGVDKKIIRRLAKTYFKANFSEEQEGNRQFEEFYDGVMK